MRRTVTALSLALAAFTFLPGTPAHAGRICANAWARTPDTGTVSTNYTCIYDYPYGVYCDYYDYWNYPWDIEAHAWMCTPGIIGTAQ